MKSVVITTTAVLSILIIKLAFNEIIAVSDPYCFKFTWVGPRYDFSTTNQFNCSIFGSNPCIPPFVVTNDSTRPNVTDLWLHRNDYEVPIACPMRPGYVCIKHAFKYNNAVLNTTYFCGKMTEDKTFPIESGCYEQKIRGHLIEACACKSNPGQMPCNSTSKVNQNFILIILAIGFLLFNQIT